LAATFMEGTLHVPDIQGDLLGGRVRGALTVSPEATGGARRVALTLSDLHLPGVLAPLGLGTVRADARITGGAIEVGPAGARWADARLDVTGRVEAGQRVALHADLDADLGLLGQVTVPGSVAGRVRMTADSTGTWERPVLAGQVETGPLVLATQPVDRAEL